FDEQAFASNELQDVRPQEILDRFVVLPSFLRDSSAVVVIDASLQRSDRWIPCGVISIDHAASLDQLFPLGFGHLRSLYRTPAVTGPIGYSFSGDHYVLCSARRDQRFRALGLMSLMISFNNRVVVQ